MTEDTATATTQNTDMARFPLGTLKQQGDDRFTLTFIRDFPHPIVQVWEAITNPAMTIRWWAETRIDLRPGGQFDARWLNSDDGKPRHWTTGIVQRLDPPRLIEHTNSDHGLLRWELAETSPSSTRLTFTNEFTGEAKWVPMSLAGWHVHLDHLAEALVGKAVDWPAWYLDFLPAWQSLNDTYIEVSHAE
ncbi:MAG: SRPBCC family protein [Thermomicrobiales bacterium]